MSGHAVGVGALGGAFADHAAEDGEHAAEDGAAELHAVHVVQLASEAKTQPV